MAIRFILSYGIFVVGLLLYPHVFQIVGYMYKIIPEVSVGGLILAAVCMLILTLFSETQSDFLCQCFDIGILGVFMPIAVMSVMSGYSIFWMLIPFASLLVSIFVVRFIGLKDTRSSEITRTRGSVFGRKLQKITFLMMVAGMGAVVIKEGGSVSFNLLETYSRVYEIRSEAAVGGVLGYFIGWFILVFFPILISSDDFKTKKTYLFACVACGFFLFQKFGLKSIFLNLFLVIFFGLRFKRFESVRTFLPHIFFMMIFLVSYLIGKEAFPLLDRFFYLVGLNSIYYFEFYSSNPLRFFEGTKLDFGLSSYGVEPGYTIDANFYDGLGTNQSAGYIPSIYSDLGIIGVFIYSIIVGVFIRSVYSVRHAGGNMMYLVIVSFMFSLMNHPVNMLLLSNGLIFIIGIIFCFNNLERSNFQRLNEVDC